MQTQHPYNEESNSETLSLIGRIFQHATLAPNHEAIVTPDYTLSYSQLAQLIANQAVSLTQLGVSENAVVGINSANDIEHLLLCLASTYLGATSCTIPSYERPEVQQSVIQKCNITHVVEHAVALNNREKPLSDTSSPSRSSNSACLLFSTSGSTGEPKLVIHHDSDVVAQAHRHIDSTQERFACRATVEHNFAKRHRLYCFAVGATNIFLGEKLENIVEDCLSLNVNVLHVSAFQAQELLHLPNIGQLSSIRLKLGGSHVPEPLREALRRNITPTLQAGYGTTETGAIAFTHPEDDEAAESVGQALPGIHIQCVDPNRKPVEKGERGEVAIRCQGLFRGYLNNPALTNQRVENGWFYTGDIAYLDEKDRIHLCGRSDDMFTFNSMNIYPQEIETIIKAYPDVIDAVVLPKPSETHGNIPVALVVYNPNLRPSLSALRKFVEKQVGVRSPRQYIFVDKIPKNTSGKISRSDAASLTKKSGELRETLISLVDDKSLKEAGSQVVKAFIKGERDLSFGKLGMDSLARMNLLVAVEVNYDVVISPQELIRLRTLGKLASRLANTSETSHNNVQSIDNELKFEYIPQTEDEPPYIVLLFQRFIRYCKTATQLNQIFSDLEYRLTPLDVAYLDNAHHQKVLNIHTDNKKLDTAISHWLAETKRLMFKSGNKSPEPFSFKRITHDVMLFSNGDNSHQKRLIIAFTPRDAPHMMVPNAVLLQHIDAKKYDLLTIAGVHRNNYQFGKLPFGKKLHQLTEWLVSKMHVKEYQEIRTLGFSSGGFPAVVLGHLLNAKIALSIGGRMHRRKYFMANLDQILTLKKAYKTGSCACTIASHSAGNKRDQKFAKLLAKTCHARRVTIDIKTERLPHLPLRRLIERGELATYFAHTLLTELDVLSNNKLEKIEEIEAMCFPFNDTSFHR